MSSSPRAPKAAVTALVMGGVSPPVSDGQTSEGGSSHALESVTSRSAASELASSCSLLGTTGGETFDQRRRYLSLSTVFATLVMLILSVTFVVTHVNLHYDRQMYRILSRLEAVNLAYQQANLYTFQQAAFLEMEGLTNGTYPIPDWAEDNFVELPDHLDSLQASCDEFESFYDDTHKELNLLDRAKNDVDDLIESYRASVAQLNCPDAATGATPRFRDSIAAWYGDVACSFQVACAGPTSDGGHAG